MLPEIASLISVSLGSGLFLNKWAADINIHAAQLSEDAEGPGATILLRIDRDVPADVRTAITETVGAKLLEVVDLS